MKTRKQICTNILSLLFLLIISCSIPSLQSDDDRAGSGTESVVGKVTYPDNTPAKSVQVIIRPSHYLPISDSVHLQEHIDTTYSNESGNFQFLLSKKGNYVIEAKDDSGNKAFVNSIQITNIESTVELSAITLKTPGKLTGTIKIPKGLDHDDINIMVYGLDRIVQPRNDGTFSFEYLAESQYDLVVLSNNKNIPPIITNQLSVISGKPTNLDTLIFSNTFFTFTSPNGGEKWTVGDTVNITWESDFNLNANLVLMLNNETLPNEVFITSINPSQTTSYTWVIPDTDIQVSSSKAKVEINHETGFSSFQPIYSTLEETNLLSIIQPNPDRYEPNNSEDEAYRVQIGDTIQNGITEYITYGDAIDTRTDYFVFPASQGQKISIQLNAPGNNVTFDIYGPGGFIAEGYNEEHNGHIITIPDTGDYYIIVEGYEGQRYSLYLQSH